MKHRRILTAAMALIILLLVTALPAAANDQARFGFGANSSASDYDWATLGAGWFHAWRMQIPYTLPGLDFYPMVGAYGDLMGNETLEQMQSAINARPENYPDGTVWIISNELQYDTFCTKNGVPLNPCRAITPDEYAQKYKKYRDWVKQINPTYKTAIGFINAIEEVGRPYTLADFLDAYQARYGEPMPVDAFNLHAYGFGRSIDFDYCFRPTIETYRQVMADYGYRDKPLVITEVGVLEGVYVGWIPESYVLDFQIQAFDYLRTATSETTGMPSDGNRLVQRWAWFALTGWHPSDDHKWDKTALFDIDTKAITAVGQQYSDYVASLIYTADIPLEQGWNMISLPVEPESYDVADVFASVDGSYDLVYAFDAAQGEWLTYDVNLPPQANSLTTLDATMGLWVHMTQAATLSVTGVEQTVVDIPLYTGWNLVSYPLLQGQPIEDALASIDGKYTSVRTYDAFDPSDPWKNYLPGAPSFVSDLSDMMPEHGYWIEVTEDCTLTFTANP